MKSPFLLLLIFSLSSHAQPTGQQKLFLEIMDQGEMVDFRTCFQASEMGSKEKLELNRYQLLDVSADKTGFAFYRPGGYIHKTLMDEDNTMLIVKDKKDTMRIELRNAFNVYYLKIPFQKGTFRIYVNDGIEHRWDVNRLPHKAVRSEPVVYDITPADWSVFQVSPYKTDRDYFVSTHFEKQNLLAMPVIPEDDPNFRNPRRMKNLRLEIADYNFDGQKDYREQKWNDTTKWNYFIYSDQKRGFVMDTLLSSLDLCYFDFEKKIFSGSRTLRIHSTLTQMDQYAYQDGKAVLVRQLQCVHRSPHSERMDCSVFELENGKMVFKKLISGAE